VPRIRAIILFQIFISVTLAQNHGLNPSFFFKAEAYFGVLDQPKAGGLSLFNCQ
jgi:hypothetical protein